MTELERLRELIAINRATTTSLDYDEVLQRVVEKTAEFAGAEACLLLLVDQENRAAVAASTGLDDAKASGFCAPMDEKIGTDLVEFFDIPDRLNFVGVPVINQEGLLGILALFRQGGEAMGSGDDYLLAALADQAAIALRHAAKVRELRRDLVRREALTERIFQHAPLGFCVIDADLVIRQLNATGSELLGQSRDSLLNRPVAEVFKDSAREILALCRRALVWDPPSSVEVLYKRPDEGSEAGIPFAVLCAGLPDEADGGGAVLMILEDVSPRKRVEAVLRAKDELNRKTLQALPAHIAVIGRDGRVLAVNEAWQAFARSQGAGDSLGLAEGADYLAVCRHSAAANDTDADSALAGIEAVLSGAAEEFALEYLCDGPRQRQWFLMTVVPLGQAAEGGAVISHLDISERKYAEEALRSGLEELRTKNDELERFNRVAVDRELRMIELKKQINELCIRIGEAPRYRVEISESGQKPSA